MKILLTYLALLLTFTAGAQEPFYSINGTISNHRSDRIAIKLNDCEYVRIYLKYETSDRGFLDAFVAIKEDEQSYKVIARPQKLQKDTLFISTEDMKLPTDIDEIYLLIWAGRKKYVPYTLDVYNGMKCK